MKNEKCLNKNPKAVILGFIMIIVLTSLLIMITASRNTSVEQGTDNAKIAKFEYKIFQTEGNDDDQELIRQGSDINIFDTATDTGVTSNGGGKIIAPGTAGYFEFWVKNYSEMPIKVTFDDLSYRETKNNNLAIPIIFYFNGKYYSQLYNQSLSVLGNDYSNKSGADWKYYFNADDAESNSHGISLQGNIDNLKSELNTFSTISTSTVSATLFLDYFSTDTAWNDRIRLAWFYPYEARINGTEIGNNFGTGYKIYQFDIYNNNFINNDVTVSMNPILRVSQIDEFGTVTKPLSGRNNYGFDADKWYRKWNDENRFVNDNVTWQSE